MREKMKRRSKRGPNNSESTGKIGQELPQNQVAPPLRPSYGDAPMAAPSHDAENEAGEPFGDAGLDQVAHFADIEAILEHVAGFQAEDQAQDDCTALQVQYLGESQRGAVRG